MLSPWLLRTPWPREDVSSCREYDQMLHWLVGASQSHRDSLASQINHFHNLSLQRHWALSRFSDFDMGSSRSQPLSGCMRWASSWRTPIKTRHVTSVTKLVTFPTRCYNHTEEFSKKDWYLYTIQLHTFTIVYYCNRSPHFTTLACFFYFLQPYYSRRKLLFIPTIRLTFEGQL